MTTLSINEDLLEQINAEAQSEARPVAEIIATPSGSFMDFYGVFKDDPIPDKLKLRKEFTLFFCLFICHWRNFILYYGGVLNFISACNQIGRLG